MNIDLGQYVVIFIIVAVAVLALRPFVTWYYNINQITKNQQTTNDLLSVIADLLRDEPEEEQEEE